MEGHDLRVSGLDIDKHNIYTGDGFKMSKPNLRIYRKRDYKLIKKIEIKNSIRINSILSNGRTIYVGTDNKLISFSMDFQQIYSQSFESSIHNLTKKGEALYFSSGNELIYVKNDDFKSRKIINMGSWPLAIHVNEEKVFVSVRNHLHIYNLELEELGKYSIKRNGDIICLN